MKTTKGRQSVKVVREGTLKARIPHDWVVVCIYPQASGEGYSSGVGGQIAKGLETVFGLYTEAEAQRAAADLSNMMPGPRVFVPMQASK